MCYEVEDPDRADEIVPFFTVREGGLSYSLSDMGTGELSAIYLIWVLQYVKPRSFILIEEPEAMLPPASHTKIFDLICVKAMEQELAVAIATHSPDIVSALPLAQILFLNRLGGVSTYAAHAEQKYHALSELGLNLPKTALFMVEDVVALHTANELIARFDNHLAQLLEIRNIGSGFGALKVILDNIPEFESIRIFGLLDGDMLTKTMDWRCKDSCFYLPFGESMEVEFLRSVRQNVPGFAQKVNRSTQLIERGLRKAEGIDPHDGFKDFCSAIGFTLELGVNFCFSHWLEVFQRHETCVELVIMLRSKLFLK